MKNLSLKLKLKRRKLKDLDPVTVITRIALRRQKIILSQKVKESVEKVARGDTHVVKEITKTVLKEAGIEVGKRGTRNSIRSKINMKVEKEVKREKIEKNKILEIEETVEKEELVVRGEIVVKNESTLRKREEEVQAMTEAIERVVILTRTNTSMKMTMMKKIVTEVVIMTKSHPIEVSTTMMINANVVEGMY